MTTLSVPLPAKLEKVVADTAKARGSNKAEVVRYALTLMAEEEAVQTVLRAEQEIADGKILEGDLRKLAKQLA